MLLQLNMNELITDYTNNLPDIILSDIQNHGPKYKKVNVYNNSIKSPLQKIWIRTPKMKIFKPTFNPTADKKSVSLTILLAPNTKDIKRFKIFIKKLEQRIASLINLSDQHTIRSSIKSSDNYADNFTIKMPYTKINDCYEFSFHIYNIDNKRVSLKMLESGMYTSCYIELTDVWISDIEFGFNWNVLQMKLYPEFDFSKCLFLDENIEEKKNLTDQECYHCLFCPNNHIRTHFCTNNTQNNVQHSMDIPLLPPPPPPPPPVPQNILINKPLQITKKIEAPKIENTGFRLTVNDLLSVKLKPISKINNNNENNDNNINLAKIKESLKTKQFMDIPTIMRSVLSEKKSDDFKKTDEEYKKLINYLINQ